MDQPISGIADSELLKIKFEVDINPPKYASFEQAKRDVEPFIRDTQSLKIWSTDFFKHITDNLTVI